MKEAPGNLNLDPEEQAVIESANLAIATAKKRKRLDLVYMVKGQKYSTIKIALRRKFTHLTTAFAQTEYGPQETPLVPLEIKVDADNLTDDVLIDSTIAFCESNFPNLNRATVNIFGSLREYINKRPSVSFVTISR